MKIQRRLTEAIDLSLQMDHLCFKGELFSEAYLVSAVGQILSSCRYGIKGGGMPIAEYTHPDLLKHNSKRGRKPSIDYIIANYKANTGDEYTKIKFAIECKWAGSPHCTVENFLWDAIRLGLVSASSSCDAQLLIAGEKSDIETFLKSSLFQDNIVSTKKDKQKTLNFTNPPPIVKSYLSKVKAKYPDLKVSQHLDFSFYEGLLTHSEHANYACVSWSIRAKGKLVSI